MGKALRLLTICTRASMLILLGMILNQNEFGLFNLITAFVSYSILLVGLDVYVVTTRKIVSAQQSEKKELIKCHYIITVTSFVLFIPVILYFGSIYDLSKYYLILTLLAFLEYLNQDLYRILVAIENYTVASLGLAIRSAAWVWVLFFLYTINRNGINLNSVLYTWLLFDVIALVYSGIYLHKILGNCRSEKKFTAWIYYASNFRKIAAYWISTIAFKFTSVADKMTIPLVGSVSDVGPYGLAFSVASLGGVVYEALKLDSNYARWSEVLSGSSRDNKKKGKLIKSELNKSIYLGLAYGFFLALVLLLSKNLFPGESNFNIPYYTILQCSLFSLFIIPHQAMNFINYLSGNDKVVLVGNYMGFLIFVVVLITAYVLRSKEAVGFAPVLSMLLMTYLKGKCLLKYRVVNEI